MNKPKGNKSRIIILLVVMILFIGFGVVASIILDPIDNKPLPQTKNKQTIVSKEIAYTNSLVNEYGECLDLHVPLGTERIPAGSIMIGTVMVPRYRDRPIKHDRDALAKSYTDGALTVEDINSKMESLGCDPIVIDNER